MDPAALRMVRVRPMTLAQRQRLAEVTERARETWYAHLLAKKDKEALLLELRAEGWSNGELAKLLGVSRQRVFAMLKERGIDE